MLLKPESLLARKRGELIYTMGLTGLRVSLGDLNLSVNCYFMQKDGCVLTSY